MSRIWAVARHTIAESIRMRVFLVILVLVAAICLGLPLSIKGDGSLTGAVQSFLTYGLIATGLLLGMLTVFMSRSLADELVQRQIYLIATKPIPRWQFILGKWLGVTLLTTGFLVCSGATMYGMIHVIRRTHPPIDKEFDRQTLENEILTARHALQSEMPDFTLEADAEFERNREQGLYENVPNLDAAEERLRLARKHEAQWRVVGPLDARLFEFKNVLVSREAGSEIQLRYKTDVRGGPWDEVFRARWVFGNRFKGTPERIADVRHFIGRYHTIPVPADVVADDNTLTVRFYNKSPFEGEPQARNVIEFRKSEPVEVLFAIGSFEGNLARVLVLMACKLAFLAAVATLMTTVFSYPVASLASFTIYALAGTRGFLNEAFDFAAADYAPLFSSVKQFAATVVGTVYNSLFWVLPDFAKYNPIEDIVAGRNVSLVWVLQGVVGLGLLKTAIVLGLAMLVFQRREVAEVSL